MRMTGNELKRLRLERGESQAAFARHFGVSQVCIHRWETGGIPQWPFLHKAMESLIKELPRKRGKAA